MKTLKTKNGSRRGNEADSYARLPGNPPRYLGGYGACFTHALKLALIVACLAAASPGVFGQMLINGAGATFPYPIYSKWFAEYARVDPSVRLNYQSIGSGGGHKQILT